MNFPVTVGLPDGHSKLTSTANINNRTLGTRGVDSAGNVFRWVRNGGTAIAGGLLTQGLAAPAGADAGQTVANTSVTGVTTLSLLSTDTSGTVVADYFAGGTITIDTSPGQASYQIADSPGAHVAATTSTAETIQFTLKEPIREALTSGTSLAFLRQSKYRDLIVAPGTVTSALVGFTTVALPANAYGWVQTAGEGMVKNINAATVVNSQLVFAGTSPGEIERQSNASNSTIDDKQVVAWSTDAVATANLYHTVKITLE